jgi:hypothetical protein
MTIEPLHGALLETEQDLYFVSASHARIVIASVKVTPVPGSALGLALFEGRVLSVLSLGRRRQHLLVCELEGQLVALSGVTVLATGALALATLEACGYAGRRPNPLNLAERFRIAMSGPVPQP